MTLWLGPTQADALAALARSAAPREACGLLLGRASGQITEIIAITNAAATPERRFRMDERELARALTSLPASGLELLGIYHSHPASDPRPSTLDVAEWAYPEVAMVIIGLRPAPAISAWMVRYGEVTPAGLAVGAALPAEGPVWTRAAQIAAAIAIIAAVVLFLLLAFTLLPPAPQIPPTPMPR